MHGLPCDHACQQHAGQRGLRDGRAAALSVCLQREPGAAVHQQHAGQSQAVVPQADVSQAVPQDGRVLFGLPQSALAEGGHALQGLPARPEPLRQLPVERRVGRRVRGASTTPRKSEPNCNGCHMPLQPSNDFGAKMFAGAEQPSVHNHLFVGANTGVPWFYSSTRRSRPTRSSCRSACGWTSSASGTEGRSKGACTRRCVRKCRP